MKNRSNYYSTQEEQGSRHWPVYLALSIVLSFCLAVLLFKASNIRGPGAGRIFLSRVAADPNPQNGSTGFVAAMPSPTIYVPKAPKGTGEYIPISFNDLSGFFYWSPLDDIDDPNPAKEKKDKLRSKVPASVMAFNDKKVAITGFMIPVDEDEKYVVKTFVLAKSQMTCCYGATPLPNEWLFATVAPNAGKVMDQMDVPLTVFGTLSIDPEMKDKSMPTLYKMTVNKVEGPKKGWFD